MSRRCLLFGLLLLTSCAVKGRAPQSLPRPEWERQAADASALLRKGSYLSLKQAVQAYSRLYAHPEFRKAIATRLAKAALLIAVREKELGISNMSYMDMALEVVSQNRSLAGLTPYAEIAGFLWVQGKGVIGEVDARFATQETEKKLKATQPELREKARADEFSAYMYATLRCLLASPSESGNEIGELAALFPDSPLLKYKKATCPSENGEWLNALLEQDPQFYEAAYHLGMIALSRGDLLQAEGHFSKTREGIPECPQATILLATIAFALEEVEKSLELYEQTLALVPDYRDALLGKAICLSTLNRPEEAIAVCEKIIALGFWLLGESYYWTAWNQHELKDNASAEASIEQAKGRLPTSTEVFTLAGLIAMERKNPAKAEMEFLEAVRYNPANSQALFNLGALYARNGDWADSGLYFEKAGFAFESESRTLQDKIAQVLYSSLAQERKDRLLQKRKSQLDKTLLSRATGFYNAAAGYFNAGQKFKALEMAARSAEHPAFKEKAGELTSGIK
jgi:tetratricopeptide (TPR) repeat protein